MRKGVLLWLLLLSNFLHAQTWEEWTEQQRLKVQRLQEQIVANKVFIDYAQKGYNIVTSGLQTIQDIKGGEFRLHINFFDSLTIVNPRIPVMRRVADIIAGQFRIIKNTKQALAAIRASEQFTASELDYCTKVSDNLLIECLKSIDMLVMLITNGAVSMSDGERIQWIDNLYADMQEKISFTASFSDEMSILALQRLTEQTEINYSKKIK